MTGPAPPRLALWPSIDLRAGRVVRLLHGELERETVYEIEPLEVAERFAADGADGLHLVDLDAAFGLGDHRALIGKLIGSRRSSVSLPVQVGGGLRSAEGVAHLLDAGASRVVLGSLPFTDAAAFDETMRRFGDRVVVALDCREGRPTVRGWTEDAGGGGAAEAARRLRDAGVRTLLVTDVARDGAMGGPNVELLAAVRAVFGGEILASGGMRGAVDLAPVAEALAGGACGAIFGRALHGGAVSVAELVRARDALGAAGYAGAAVGAATGGGR